MSAPMEPKAVNNVDIAFGGIDGLMVDYDEIPEEFRRRRTKWNELQSRWFFRGLPKETEFIPKPGVDAKLALRHLAAIQGSFTPKHEHKEACVAYLLSLWFDDVKIPEDAP